MSATGEILRSYRAPRDVMRRLLAALGRDDRPEARILAHLLAACFIVFVSQLPAALAGGPQWPAEAPTEMRVANTFFAWLFIAPLLFYGLAALSHLVARLLGGRGSFQTARAALFWTLLATAPLVLLRAMVLSLVGPGPLSTAVDAAVGVAFVLIWVISLIEAERAPAG